MLDAFKRLISRHPASVAWKDIERWAKGQKLSFKRVAEDEGFVIEGACEGKSWRLEWGPPQRHYIEGRELRMRMDLGLSCDSQMLVLAKSLFETLERHAFESFTQTTQTVIDGNTPEEMRWLVMFPTVNFKASKQVRSRFQLIGSDPLEAATWLEGGLALLLEQALEGFLAADVPFMLMLLRGRLYLRLQLSVPDASSVAQALAVFQLGVLQALRSASMVQESADTWQNSSGTTAWQTQLGPDDPAPNRH